MVAVCALCAVVCLLVACDADPEPSTTPTTHDGQPWRIAYYEGGPYINYTQYLRALVDGLVKLGWLEPLTVPDMTDDEDAFAIWQYLANKADSRYIEFVPNAFWSGNWDEQARAVAKEHALERLVQEQDIDLILALGTWAGQDLANDLHSIPTVVLSTSDPIGAGIIASAEDSGLDHVHAKVNPNQHRRQVELLADTIEFERLGVAYEDSADGRAYTNLDDLEAVALERGFEIVRCFAQDTGLSEQESRQGIERCYRDLAPQIDALWIGNHSGEKAEFMPDLLEPMFEYNVPTWAGERSAMVRRGALLSLARVDYSAEGDWTARVIAEILNGARPRDLAQIFEHPYQIAINMETARRIGFEVPPGILQAADEVYESIEGE
jgi:ABC-type uncharacterized transport system substrate-binding protein